MIQTVGDLIEALQAFPADMPIFHGNEDEWDTEYTNVAAEKEWVYHNKIYRSRNTSRVKAVVLQPDYRREDPL